MESDNIEDFVCLETEHNYHNKDGVVKGHVRAIWISDDDFDTFFSKALNCNKSTRWLIANILKEQADKIRNENNISEF